MARPARAADVVDSPWKDALQQYLPHFLTFFFPDIHADIDWTRGYESLDKEFEKIARCAGVGKLIADKLFKVWLKDGGEHWLLIHIEIQGDYEKEFPERMFAYNSAARQLYNKEVVSLAALCDDNLAWKPTTFGYGRWGCRMELTFRVVKLLEYGGDVPALETSDNPIAAVVLANLKSQETRKDPESRRDWKLRIVKGLYRRGWSKDDIVNLFRMIDWMMALPEELEAAFRADLQELPEEKPMRYVTSIERLAKEEAAREVWLENIALDLNIKFGAAGRKLMRRIKALPDAGALRRLNRFLKRTTSVDEIREYLEQFPE